MRKPFVPYFFVAILLGVVLTIGCGGGGGGGGGSSPVSPTTPGTFADLSGKVTYLGKPVANAAVFLVAETKAVDAGVKLAAAIKASPTGIAAALGDDFEGLRTTTNAEGAYFFSQVAVGTYTVIAMLDPSHQISQSVIVGAISNLDLALKPTGNISGVVMQADEGGNLNPYVGFLLYLQGTSYVGITGTDGSFIIQNVPISSAPYTLLPAYGNSYIFKTSPVLVTVQAGVTTPIPTVEVLQAKGTITGIAQLATGTDFSNISVSTNHGGFTTTDASGAYTLTNIYGFGQVRITYSRFLSGVSYTASQTVTLSSLATLTAPLVILQPEAPSTADLEVNLVGLQGGNSVSFELWRQGSNFAYDSYGNNFPASPTYSNVATGTWGVKVFPGSDYILLNPAPGSTNQVASQTVAEGGAASFTVLVQYTRSNLSGTIAGIDPSFTSGITAYLQRPGFFDSYGLNSGGFYQFTGVATGTYSLRFQGTGYQPSSAAIVLAPGANTSNFAVTPIFPTLNSVSQAGTIVTLAGTRFVVSTSSIFIAPAGQGGSTYAPTTQTAGTMTYNFAGFNPGLYDVRAQAQDGAQSLNSGQFSVPFVASPTITSTNTDIGTTTFVFKWNSLNGATGYNVREISGLVPGAAVDQNTFSFNFTGLQPNTSYTFGVYATGNGIANSPENTMPITTKKIFSTPVVYDAGLSISYPTHSFVKNGFLYVLDDAGGPPYNLIRFDLNNPTAAGATTSIVLTTPPSGTPTCLYVDTYVFVGWKANVPLGTKQVILQRYNLDLSGGVQGTFTGDFPTQAGGIKVLTNPTNASQLEVLSFGLSGPNAVASLTYLDNFSLGNLGEVTKSFTNPVTNLEWTSFTGSDGNPYIARLFQTSGGTFFDVYDPTLTTSKESGGAGGTLYDIVGAPAGTRGYAWIDGSFHFRNPPGAFGVQIYDGGTQAALDDTNTIYIYQEMSSGLNAVNRYSPKGILLDATEFQGGFSASFGAKRIHFDSLNKQIVIVKPLGNGNLGALTFSTLN